MADVKRVYLASPYSHPCPLVRWWRWLLACRATAALTAQGIHVYSPIVHGHWLGVLGRLPKGWGYWQQADCRELACSRHFWVLRLKGWAQSQGVKAELELARGLGLTVRLLKPGDLRNLKHEV